MVAAKASPFRAIRQFIQLYIIIKIRKYIVNTGYIDLTKFSLDTSLLKTEIQSRISLWSP